MWALSAGLATTAIWLAFDNPDISGTSRGDHYTCLAPWDTVLNDADNLPGGETPPDGEDIAERCRNAGRDRFVTSAGSGSAAVVLAGFAMMSSRRPSRVDRS